MVGAFSLNGGSGGTGSFCVNADGSPDMGVTVKAGQAYIKATPSSQDSQVLRPRAAADYTAYTINANASGSTKYDWIYLSVDATKANNPAADASDVTSIYTSRSTSNTTDNGTPPTYGLLLAVVTVANAASSITNSNITDKRIAAVIGPTSNNTLTSLFDYVDSGCVWSGDSYASTLNASMTSGVVRIGGAILTVGTVSARAFTASKDTYIDLKNNGDGTAVPVYTEVTNNAASPALTAGNMRIGIIVTGASSIAAAGSVNQGQITAVLPIATSQAYSVTDSLGNLICPRDSTRKMLGYAQITGNVTSTSNTAGAVLGLSIPIIPPTGRKVKVTFHPGHGLYNSTINDYANSYIFDGATSTALTNQIIQNNSLQAVANDVKGITLIGPYNPASGLRFITAAISRLSAGTVTLASGGAGDAAYILAELE